MQEFTILVVDDDPAILKMLDELLSSKENHKVVLAGDSKEAAAQGQAPSRSSSST